MSNGHGRWAVRSEEHLPALPGDLVEVEERFRAEETVATDRGPAPGRGQVVEPRVSLREFVGRDPAAHHDLRSMMLRKWNRVAMSDTGAATTRSISSMKRMVS